MLWIELLGIFDHDVAEAAKLFRVVLHLVERRSFDDFSVGAVLRLFVGIERHVDRPEADQLLCADVTLAVPRARSLIHDDVQLRFGFEWLELPRELSVVRLDLLVGKLGCRQRTSFPTPDGNRYGN